MNQRSAVPPGAAFPLGATVDGAGTNVSVFASAATRLAVCPFDEDGTEERVALVERTGPWFRSTSPGEEFDEVLLERARRASVRDLEFAVRHYQLRQQDDQPLPRDREIPGASAM